MAITYPGSNVTALPRRSSKTIEGGACGGTPPYKTPPEDRIYGPTLAHDGQDEQEKDDAPYAQTIAFAEYQSDGIALLEKKNYKIRVTIWERANLMKPMSAITDTGAGANLTSRRAFHTFWYTRLIPVRNPGLTAVANQSVEVQGVILLHVRIGDLRFRIWFRVVQSLAVPLLLGTFFIDRFVLTIFTPERQLVPEQSQTVAFL